MAYWKQNPNPAHYVPTPKPLARKTSLEGWEMFATPTGVEVRGMVDGEQTAQPMHIFDSSGKWYVDMRGSAMPLGEPTPAQRKEMEKTNA